MARSMQRSLDMITRDQIKALRTESVAAGDLEMVHICDAALAGDEPSIADCAEAIEENALLYCNYVDPATGTEYVLEGDSLEELHEQLAEVDSSAGRVYAYNRPGFRVGVVSGYGWAVL